MRTTFVALLGLVTVACTGKPAQAPVRSVASPTPSPAPYRASPSGAPSASPSAAGGAASYAARQPETAPVAAEVNWYSRIAEAQSAARASGKLILVGSTKPGCGLCDKFAHTIAPQCWGRLSQMAVPYMFDIMNYDTKVADNVRVDRTLRANLQGAALMPLVGFLTPDLQWVHGFSGPRSVAEFMGDIESARRIYPVHAASLPQPAPITGPAVAVVNEFGENEWSAPADWPAPEDALGPVASVTVNAPAADAPLGDPVVAVAPAPAPETTVAVEPAPVVAIADTAPPEPTPAPAPTWSETAAMPSNLVVTRRTLLRTEPTPVAPPVETPAPSPAPALTPAGSTMTESDADATLRGAFEAIRAGRFDEARTAVKQVSRSLPNTAVGREADRGAVAIYNARLIASADAGQRAALTERAKKDLGSSMWVTLF